MGNNENNVQQFWKSLIPEKAAEKPWLFNGRGNGMVSASSKDLYAQANCLAAFLRHRGIQAGDKVVICMVGGPRYLFIDLALQFIGAINVTLPADLPERELVALANHFAPDFLCTDQQIRLYGVGNFSQLVEKVKGILLLDDDPGEIPPEKLFTFERAVVVGKSDWREDAPGLTTAKEARGESELYGELPVENAARFSETSFAQLISLTGKATRFLQEKKIGNLLAVGSPQTLERRIIGYFAPLQARIRVEETNAENFELPLKLNPNPEAIFLSPEHLNQLYTEIARQHLGKNGEASPRFKKAREVADKRRALIAEGKKVPFGLRTQFTLHKSSFYSKAKKLFGNNCRTLILNEGTAREETLNFFRDLDFLVVTAAEILA